ncbi:MAG: glycosyltransferase family 2 protein [Chitinophagaceae bacterium]
MTLQPSVAVVILNWNTASFLQKFLPAILSAGYDNKEIYVIDNNSTDDSVAMLRQYFPSVHILQMTTNKGFAGGYNFGLNLIKANYYLIVNSDLEVSYNFINPLVSLMEANPHIAICQPKLLSLDNKKKFEYAGAAGGWIDKLGFPFTRGRILTTIEEDSQQYETAEPVFWASGACMCIRATVFEKTGGFYDYYYMHQEDIDLCWRVQNMGYAIYSCPQSVVYHMGGGTLSWENHLKTFLTFRNNYIMLSRNLPFFQALLVVSLRLAIDFIGCFYFLVKRKAGISRAIAKAEFAFLYWLLFWADKKHKQAKGWNNNKGIYKGTILIPYFIQNKKKFSELVKKTTDAGNII